MIEIKCSKKQKEKIIEALESGGGPCLFHRRAETCWLLKDSDCRECLEKNIKWIAVADRERGVVNERRN